MSLQARKVIRSADAGEASRADDGRKMPFADHPNGPSPLLSSDSDVAHPRLGECSRPELSARRQCVSELAAAARAAHRALFERLNPAPARDA